MKSLDLTPWLFAVCLSLVVTLANSALAQSDSPWDEAEAPASTDAAIQRIFGNQLTPIVPAAHCPDCTDDSVACDQFSTGCGSTGGCGDLGCGDLGCGDLACADLGGGGCWSDLRTRKDLSNGMWGIQPAMAKKGIVYEALLTQFYQGVTSGGGDRSFEYGGKFDQFVTFNSKELGLWEGMQIVMHAETRFGEDVIRDASLLSPVNVNMLYPSLQNETAITGLQVTQMLSEEWAVTFGKINALDLLYGLYPQTGRGVTSFMNTSLVLPLSLARTVPLSFLGAGVIHLQEQQFQSGVLVYDSYNSATTSGFNSFFENGANVTAFWRSFTETNGRPGSHLFLGTYASGDYTSLDRTGWAIDPSQGIVAPQQSGSWSLLYMLEQQLWIDACDKSRNIGLLSSWGLADKETSPYQWVANVAIQGTGLMPARKQDTIGVGYFYNGLSDEFKGLLPALNVGNVQGAELYYTAAITPWFQLTADLQVVEPALGARDTAVVAGLRAVIVP